MTIKSGGVGVGGGLIGGTVGVAGAAEGCGSAIAEGTSKKEKQAKSASWINLKCIIEPFFCPRRGDPGRLLQLLRRGCLGTKKS